jgi:hypothetical protein
MKRSVFIFVFFILILGSWTSSLSVSGLGWDENSSEIYPRYEVNDEFLITGPDELCLYYGSVIGEFFGGGRSTDVFRWRVVGSDGIVLVEREGGFQSFNHTFSEQGNFEIQLTVRRGINEVYSGSKPIKINLGADLILETSYLLCEDGKATLTLINPNDDSIGTYQIEWSDSSGGVVGFGNTITVDKPGKYTVNFFTLSQEVNQTCQQSVETNVYDPKDYSISISNREVCNTGTNITVAASHGVFGKWYFQKEGSEIRRLLGDGNTLVFNRGNLDGAGDYDIIFEVDNSGKLFCKLEEVVRLTITASPSFQFYFESGVEGCGSEDGVLVILPAVDLDYVQLRKDNTNLTRFFDLKQGVELRIPGMKAGIYRATGAVNSCTSGRTAIIPIENPPSDLMFSIEEVIGESCNESGKIDGIVRVKMSQDIAGRSFSVHNTGMAVPVIFKAPIVGEEFEFSISSGNYFMEITNQDGCSNPILNRITISSKGQVSFSAPNRFTVCEVFDFIPNTNENLIFTLTYPDNSTEVKKSGEPFVLNQGGSYTLIGVDADLERSFCPREVSFVVNLTSPIPYEPELVSRDCFGNLEYRANLFGADPGRVDIKWYNENNQVVGTNLILFPTSSGEFKLDVQPRNSETCPIPPKSFMVNQPVLEFDVRLEAAPLCPDNTSEIKFSTDSENIDKVIWYFFDSLGNAVELKEFENLFQIEVTQPGLYEAVAFNDLDCEIGRGLISVQEITDFASFMIPESLAVCDFYELAPETTLDLTYQVISPDGSEVFFGGGEFIVLDQSGLYTITASSSRPDVLLCPVTKSLQVEKGNSVDFEPRLFEQDCDGRLVFQANLFGNDISEVDIFWYNELGVLVGQEEFLTPQSYGEYSLEVRPRGSQSCPQPSSKAFDVIKPLVELDGGLSVTVFCPGNENVTISLEADLSQAQKIIWYFTDFSGNRSSLIMFNDLDEIIVSKQGTYDVEVFNEINCLVGRDMVIVMKSMDDIRPEVESIYETCLNFGDKLEIDPGKFDAYQWFLEGVLVSEEPVFSPTAIGNYSLTVTSFEGCQYSAEFLVKEACEVIVKSTTGMKVNDDEKPFMVFANSLVDRLDIWIYNNWGQLIYSCSKENLSEGEGYCIWYGDFNGGYVSPGSYSVKISVKNNSENVPKSFYSSLFVID